MGRVATTVKLLRYLGSKGKSWGSAKRKRHVDAIFKGGKKPKPLSQKQRIAFLMRHKMNYITGLSATAKVASQRKKKKKNVN